MILYFFINFQSILDKTLVAVEEIIPRIIGAIALWFIGSFLINKSYKLFKKILETKEFDPSLETFFLSFIKFGLKVLLFISIIGILGIQTTSMAAMLAGLGVAIGSAFNGSLGNFAGGVMLIMYQPIKVGEFIEFGGISGEVKSIGILNTCVITGEHKSVFLPNGMLSTGIIINWSREGKIRVDVPLSIESDIDIAFAKKIASDALIAHPLIHNDPIPEVFIESIKSGSIQLIIRPFTTQPNYWAVYNDTHNLVINAFKANKVEQGIPKQILITKSEDA